VSVAQTVRLILRELLPSDSQFYCRLLNEPSWLEFIGDRGVRTPEDADRYIRGTIAETYEKLGFGMYLVESRADGRPMGVCGLVRRPSLPGPDFGVALLPEFWRQDYAFEAGTAVLEFAARVMRESRLLAIATPNNVRSIRLLERLGFAFDGVVRLPPSDEQLRLYAIALRTRPASERL
jgi:RimJ/RimL family protein N-acetyltransferase